MKTFPHGIPTAPTSPGPAGRPGRAAGALLTGLGVILLASPSSEARATEAAPAEAPQGSGRLMKPGTQGGPEVMAVDGRPAAPGRVPEGTPQAASDLWDQLVRSIARPQAAGNGDSQERSNSFELVFEGRIRSDTGSNDYTMKFGYLEEGPGLVRAIRLGSGNQPKTIQTRGLGAGDNLEYWFKKLKGDAATGWTEMTRRDYRDAREETDQWAAISYDIARLTDPNSFRIVELRERKLKEGPGRIGEGILDFANDPGVRLPSTDITGQVGGREMALKDLAATLVWIELATPDFKDLREGKKTRRQRMMEEEAGTAPPVKRLVFGMDPKTYRPQLVIVAPHRTDMPLQVLGSLLVQCTDWIQCGPKDGPRAWIPGRFFSFETEEAPAEVRERTGLARRFSNTATADLYMLESSNMSANLERKDFLPND